MSVRNRIIQKRTELGLNQTELARRAGLTPPSISQYESGVRNPSYDAILKLSSALGVKAEYLISGVDSENKDEISLDPISEQLLKIIKNVDHSTKEKIINYSLSVTGQNQKIKIYTADPKQYAQYIYEQYFDKKLPVNVNKLAQKLDIKIIRGDLKDEADAMLLKKSHTIIIDLKLNHEARIKFAICTLIGHLILPWHTQEIYYCRKRGQSTLLTEDSEEMEAQSFTTNLITPPSELEKDLNFYGKNPASLKSIKKLADEKYEVSLTSLCHRLVEYKGDRFATVSSSNDKIAKVFSSDVPLKKEGTKLNRNSEAFKVSKVDSKEEVFLEGEHNASMWLDNVEDNEMIYESSVFNPKYDSVYTIITRLKK
ncbi:XRE family transcriptional regulator [Exiguobacterium sp. s146]|uniref:helix-turn-helix domain-containing protein n=1 Tax=Exiguobacterium sp. s146 TaxID=2751223 RepID=UPI001BE720A0|nr:XRE family transcriptional regulator [Exiguobacterium sp. s146]